MRWVVVVLLLVPRLALAQPLQELRDDALAAARDHDCAKVKQLVEVVRARDRGVYSIMLVLDKELQPCLQPKRPGVALGLSLGTTLGGLALATAGFWRVDNNSPGGTGMALGGVVVALVGPTTGHIYAGRVRNWGLAVRAAGVVVLVAGLSRFVNCGDARSCDGDSRGVGVFFGGLALTGVGTIYEIALAPGAARRWNARFTVTPVPTPSGSFPGVALAGRF